MNWWKNSVVYQIYPKSFLDTNNDGVGDLNGITKKIPYLSELGINAIWITPFFLSPMVDNGYDVQDYTTIHPMFGTMKDFDNLIDVANQHNIKIIIDIVANHTSDKHKWYQKAIAGKKKYQDYYYFLDKPIKEKQSVFGGSAWTKVGDKYVLHTFAPNQMDLNWTNPKVRKEFNKIVNFWLKKGISGIRFDVIDDIAKNLDPELIKANQNIDIERLHQYIYAWKHDSKWHNYDLLTVGESWDASIEKAKLYTNPHRDEMAMIFGFEHITANWTKEGKWNPTKLDLVKFKKIIQKWQVGIHNEGWLALFLNNHDLPRIISSYGDEKYREASAKCISLTLHMLQGTPFIYQGEEIGMTNCKFKDLDEHDDIEIFQMFKDISSKNKKYTKQQHLKYVAKMNRDNARTPMQWDNSKNAGFSEHKPWLKVNENYKQINVENTLKDKNSIFYWYQKLINLRKGDKNNLDNIIMNGDFKLINQDNKNVFHYERTLNGKKIIVIANWSSQVIKYNYNQKSIIMNNYDRLDKNKLLPWQAILIKA